MTGEGWLKHATALRALAAALAVEGNEADDLVQEAWLRAARRGDADQPKAWWSAVFRNLVRDSARQRGRRSASEQVAARGEHLPSEVEVLERLEIAQRVAGEVAKLDEPYRTAIHLRYFEGLSAEEIAQRSNAPLETIRARLRRGLQQLRERMDRACGGDRSVWSTALAAIALRGKSPVAAAAATSLVSIGGIAMSVKLASSVAAAIVLGVGAYFLWPSSEAASPHASAPILEAAAQPSLPPAVTEPAPPCIEPAPARAEAAPAAVPANETPAADDGKFEVRGTVVIVDEKGVERANESGTLSVLAATSEADVDRQELAFENGRWSTRIKKGAFLMVGKLVAGGREALLPKSRPSTPGADPIEVRGKWLPRGRLRVVDAATKQDLREIEVRSAENRGPNPDWIHPGDSSEIATVEKSIDSPFDLPVHMRVTSYWLHARGYAWARVDFDHTVGGERTVELSAPAALEIAVSGSTPPEGACVRLYPKHDVSFGNEARVSVPVALSGATRIDDMPPGHYFACVELGEFDTRQRLGETEVDLLERATARATIAIDTSKLDVDTVHLYGTLAVPEGVDLARVELVLGREGGEAADVRLKWTQMTAIDGQPLARRWDAGRVRTGAWGATVRPVLYRQLIHAEGAGELQAEIRVPELVKVHVTVADAATGAVVEPERLSWSDARIEGLSSGFQCPLMPAGSKGAYEFSAPAGVVQVSCTADGYAPQSHDLDLRTGAKSVDIKLSRASGVHVQIFDGDARLKVGLEFFWEVRCTSGDSRRPLGSPGGRSTEFEFTRLLDPGHYVIHFPELEGFQPIEAMPVDVATGQITEIAVHAKHAH